MDRVDPTATWRKRAQGARGAGEAWRCAALIVGMGAVTAGPRGPAFCVQRLAPPLVVAAAAHGQPAVGEGTLLDEVGRLGAPLPEALARGWKTELHRARPPGARAAGLHLWLGEYELAQCQQPEQAIWHFRQAQRLSRSASPHDPRGHGGKTAEELRRQRGGLAAYDTAVALYYEGAYAEAARAFQRLLRPATALPGYDARRCALWYRHAAACAGYHAERRKLGIPEPERLDPLCGAAGLAVCLRALGLPYGKAAVAAACRHTGEGSSARDVLAACRKLGVTGRAVTADEAGLKALPKPLVAYVEHDHFVAVVRADRKGVSYVCSDCGCWPGGRVDLTWKQWHALDASVYLTVSRPGSRADRLLAAALAGKRGGPAPLRLAAAVPFSRLHLAGAVQFASLVALLKLHVQNYLLPTGNVVCGSKPDTLHCPPAVSCPMDENQVCSVHFGPSDGDPVNLATGEEEYEPEPDLSVYNPHGPSIAWQRLYNSLRGPSDPYPSDEFGPGWSYSYNTVIDDPNATMYPQVVPAAAGIFFAATGHDTPATATWDILLNGTTVASDASNPSNWSVSFNTSNSNLFVAAPAGATVAIGYEVRYKSGASSYSAFFDVLASGTAPQGASTNVPDTGTSAPTSDPNWEVRLNNTVIANHASPSGWSVAYQPNATLAVQVPLAAAPTTGYEVRGYFGISAGNKSATFSVVSSRFHLAAGQKYVYFPNGARVAFTAGSVPTATQPVVSCTLDTAATAMLLEWDYDSTTPYGHYTLTFGDGTQWVMTGAQKALPRATSADLYYQLARIEDPRITDGMGHNLPLYFNYTGLGSSGFPLLATITDNNQAALLTIHRAATGTGEIDWVEDAYGRAVYYQTGVFNTTGVPANSPYPQFYKQVTVVSQIVPFGTVGPAARWTYGYMNFSNRTSNSETVPFLHTITVPSPDGVGTSQATINYDSTMANGGLVTNLVDADQNTRSYSALATDPDGTNHTQVQITNPGMPGQTFGSYNAGFDGNMNQTKMLNGSGQTVWSAAYADPNDPYRPSSVTDGNSRVTQYHWDPFGHMTYRKTNRGTVTVYTWDYSVFPLGRLVQIQEGSKLPTTISYYEPSGLVKDITTPAPGESPAVHTVTTHFDYDSLGNIVKITRPGNDNPDPTLATPITVTLNYTTDGTFTQPAAIGQPLTITQPINGTTNAVTHFRYNRRGLRVSTVDPEGHQSGAIYDLADEPVYLVEPHTGDSGAGCAYATLSYLYAGGPLTMVSQSDESNNLIRQFLTSYGKEGEVLVRSAWTGSGSNTVAVASYQWDPLHRLQQVADGLNHATGYSYYSDTGYLQKITYPGGDDVEFPSYDPVGNPLQQIVGRNGAGVTTNFLYADLDGQLSDIQPVGGPNIHIDYDQYDRRAAMTDGAGSASYAYDDLDEPLSVTTTYTGLPAQTISYGYFPDGSRRTLTTPAGTFTASYDLAARMTQLVNPFAESSSWAYLSNGWLSRQTLGNGAYTTYTTNARGFTTALQSYTSGGSLLSQFTAMAYDPVGNRTSMTSSIPAQPSYSGVTSYLFDSKNQLTREQSARLGGYTNPFGYDLAGNPSNFKGTGHNFNSDNQDTGLVYTDSGNPTTWYGNPLTFDPANQLTGYGSILTAGYTGDGLRAWKQTSAGRTYFLYDGAQPVVELNSSGAVTATNTFGPNGLLSRHTSSGSVFYQFDPQGSVAQRLNSAQAVLSSDMYDAYGTGQSTSAPSDPWGYGAQWGYFTDRETGLLLLTHRYYDPGQGRFLTRDPMGISTGTNLYSYVGSDPVGLLDPTGLAPEKRWVEPTRGNQLPVDEAEGIVFRPPARGLAPLDINGNPIELHHRNQRPEGPIDELTVEQHRRNGNHGRLHGNRESEVCHGSDWEKWKRDYWREQWDKGRFQILPGYPPPQWKLSPDGVEPDESFDLFLFFIMTELLAPEVDTAPEPVRPPSRPLPVPDPRRIPIPVY